MTALLAARRKHLTASGGLHTRTKSVRFSAPAFARLISALWQSNPPFGYVRPRCKVSAQVPTQNFRYEAPHRSTHTAPNQTAVHKPHPRPSANQLV
jgi:hypothetical protein